MKKQLTTLMIGLGLAAAAIAQGQDERRPNGPGQNGGRQNVGAARCRTARVSRRQEGQAVQEASQEGPEMPAKTSDDMMKSDKMPEKNVRRQNEGHAARRPR